MAAIGLLLILTSQLQGQTDNPDVSATRAPTEIPSTPTPPETSGSYQEEEKRNNRDFLGVPTLEGEAPQPPVFEPLNIPVPEMEEEPDSESAPFLKMSEEASVLYDAQTIGFDKTGSHYQFSGEVVLIGGGYVITADQVDVAYLKKELTATGHVIMIHQNQVFTGDRVFIRWEKGDFAIDNAVLTAGDPQKIREVSQKILGLSVDELNYETARDKRLKDINLEKDQLREDFRRSNEVEPNAGLLLAYTRLLQQQNITSKAQAPSLAQQEGEKRRRFERRRIFWKKARDEAAKIPMPKAYVRLQGGLLERTDGNSYHARDATFTPCLCDEDESPAWGFQADEIFAQQEGYIDLKHPVLTIKGIPVIYLPYMKLPLKTRRQSGFLMPAFQTGQEKNGFVYTQPLFLDLGKNADTTITTDVFQKRGVRVGAEARYEARTHSGIRYQVEGIRDQSWLQLTSERRDLLKYHLVDQPYCTQTDPIELQKCINGVVTNLTPPSNTWRGQQDWDGRYSLAPRLSLVTKGKVVSDHRYLEDLYIPEDQVTAFANQSDANRFSTSKGKANLDGKDLYAGLEFAFADNSISQDRYSGQQVPVDFTIQSRYFRLFPQSWWSIPTYAEIKMETLRIAEWGEGGNLPGTGEETLGDGNWQRIGMQLTTPLSTTGVVRVDHFLEGEVRYIQHQNFGDGESTIRSWMTGISLNLPIDGMAPLPGWLQPEGLEGERFGHHIMNWELRFSVRPEVIRDGTGFASDLPNGKVLRSPGRYGIASDRNGAPLVYFPSDANRVYTDIQDIPNQDIMVKHERITLRTTHAWRIFDRVQEAVSPTAAAQDATSADLYDMQAQARRELLMVRDSSPRSVDQMYQENDKGGVDWLIRRYRTIDKDMREPVQLGAEITYDAEQERLRNEQIKKNKELEESALSDPANAADYRGQKTDYFNLAQSWIGPSAYLNFNWAETKLGTSVVYDIYKRASTSLAFELGLPTFYKTQLGLRYVLDKTAQLDQATNDALFKRTKTTTVGMTTGIVPKITAGANYIRRVVEDEAKPQYATSYQIGYDDRSGCWGIHLLREKGLNQDERDANYIFQLAVIFLGNRRSVDVSPGIERAAGREQD